MSQKHSRHTKATISELKLEVNDQRVSTAKKLSNAQLLQKPSRYIECEQPGTNLKTVSLRTLSVQNIEFPGAFKSSLQPQFQVTNLANIATYNESSKSTSIRKIRGYDFSSSTNSHFEGLVHTSPKKAKPKYFSSSTENKQTSSSLQSSVQPKTTTTPPRDEVNSREMIDSQHEASLKRINFKGPEWQVPCQESFVAGAAAPYIGICPKNLEELSRMSRTRQKFFLTQDPRKTHCLRNPLALRKKAISSAKEFSTLEKMVKHADNICASDASQSSESFICQEVDLENPMQLDFQGMDYKSTYQNDEQDMQNQRTYNHVCRYMERKRVHKEMEELVLKTERKHQLSVPERFIVEDRNEPPETPSSVDSGRFGRLYRSKEKPRNKQRIQDEGERRKQRYKDIYMRNKARREAEEKKQAIKDKEAEENLATTLAIKNFDETVHNIVDAFQRSLIKETTQENKVSKRRTFPHTIRETMQFKKTMKAQNRVIRDTARVKRDFYLERCGETKDYPEADLIISSDTPRHSAEQSLSEQSSDIEDNMQVGKEGERFKLRGFQYKLEKRLRGKRHEQENKQPGQHKEKTCITREMWLQELAPKKEIIKLDVELGVEKIQSPDDPNLVLFRPQFGYRVGRAKESAVAKYVQKRLGRHYDRDLRKNLKLVKPRLAYNVKKFNLISFLYGDQNKRKDQLALNVENDMTKMKLNTTVEYMEAKQLMKKQRREQLKKKRLELLGIPCPVVKKSRLQIYCENSESESNSDWVPEPEPEYDAVAARARSKGSHENAPHLPLRQRGNMPAPKYRESTLRCHPQHPRDYLGERVPSELFDQRVCTTGIPYMRKIPDDRNDYENARMPKREYTAIFDARHHHDHWNPTQKKMVDVCYQPKIVTPEVTKVKQRMQEEIMENFKMANPPSNAFANTDLTLMKCDVNTMIAEKQSKSKGRTGEVAKERTVEMCRAYEFVARSRRGTELAKLDYPGRQEYLQFLQEIKHAIYEKKVSVDTGEEQLCVDKEELYKELEDDLKSIESCLSSMVSSQCTNFSNDSGSFLLLDGKTKVPLDYIRKSLVPFEELQRSRFQIKPIDVDAEEANPFRVFPFSGQRSDQAKMVLARDSFFTFNTRLKNGLRLRLEVPVVNVKEKLLGKGKMKYPGAVTTDIDESYVTELKNRPPVKMFNFKSGRSFIKDALRLKFESMLIQGQIVRTKIYDRLNNWHWVTMQTTKTMYEKLFAKWEKAEYENAMAVVYQVKSYYDMTDLLKREFRELERQLLVLTMDIVFTEGHWIRRIMLQNFHYLLADQDWRYQHDWIHRVEGLNEHDEPELESFEDSIQKRNIVNIRKRDKDDAWAIKTFYEEVYKQNEHPILFVFPDADSFMKGIENLKVKTFVLLLELHFTISIHTELQIRLETFEEWCIEDLREKKEYVSRKCSKKYFMEDRVYDMEDAVYNFLAEPIEHSYNDEEFNRHCAVITEVWRHVVPASLRGSSDQEPEPIEMVGMMSNLVFELVGKFENINMKYARKVEVKLRRLREYHRKLSMQAYQTERRIESEMKKVRRNLEPPYQKPKRVGKLPRLYIKKKKTEIPIREIHISEYTKFFFRAFHDEGDVMQSGDARESMCVLDTIQEQIVPFYFDHFLKLNGYTPNYNFKTQIELRDGPELDRMEVLSVIPEVLERMDRWDIQRKRIMEDNIQRNPKMYVNVI